MTMMFANSRRNSPDSLTSQERLLPFLLDPNSYPHRPRSVRLIQTHASFVFLVPPFVYKVKKPVNFGFLDFSTLAKREHYCHREVTLNRRLSPKTYLGVVPISTAGGDYNFGRGDQIVEYAVKMRELSKSYFLDQLLERQAATTRDLDRIARVLRNFCRRQHPAPEIESWGRISTMKAGPISRATSPARWPRNLRIGSCRS